MTAADPPPLFALAGHAIRWRLLSALALSDHRVGELCRLAGERQSLVSYHLRKLRQAGVVRARRSTADGRDSYYALDLAVCRALLDEAARGLHPGLATTGPPRPARVLFLCTGNSGRSQIAEALTEARSHGRVRAFSAGSHPKPVHADALRVLAARGIPSGERRSKHLDEFRDQRFDRVVTLCDRVREVCPEFPGSPRATHWSIPDPGAATDSHTAFDAVAGELETRIAFLLASLAAA